MEDKKTAPIPRLDITQIEGERRSTLELLLIVLFLAFFLNIVASAVYDYFVQNGLAVVLLWVSVVLSAAFLFLFARFVLLRPVKIHTEIPVVLFFDTNACTVSVPTRIHHLRSGAAEVDDFHASFIPFPILCRGNFDVFKEYTKVNLSSLSDQIVQGNILASLVQFIFIDHYTKDHSITWRPFHNVTVGPFRSGWGYELPSKKYDRAELTSLSENEFIGMSAKGFSLILPDKTSVQFPSPRVLNLSNPLFRAEIRVFPSGSQPLEYWKHSRGVSSTWYRELSSDYSNTTAHLFDLQIDFSLNVGIWRFFAVDRIPSPFWPKIPLWEICEWINSWVASAHYFFEWVDEDMRALPDSELAVLVEESTLTYKPKLRGSPHITFGGAKKRT